MSRTYQYLGFRKKGITGDKIIILPAALIASLAFEILLSIIRERFSKGYNISNFKSLMNKYFHLSYDEINSQGPINLIDRIVQAVNNIYFFMTGDYIQIWSGILVITVILIIAATKHPTVAIIMASVIPVNYFGYRLLNKELSKRSENLQRETASGWQKIISVAGQTDYIKQCSSYDFLLAHMELSATEQRILTISERLPLT